MGVWGTGLYSSDFAADLRSAATAVSRLPFDGDTLASMLRDTEPEAADDPADPDHTTFWLVIAAQFAPKGLLTPSLRDKALSIIDTGQDLTILTRLGMDPKSLDKRRKMLADLRLTLTAATPPAKPRRVLKAPQPLLFETADLLVYPTSRGEPINPYFPSPQQIPDWHHDGWGAMLIALSGHAFGFLAWYLPLTLPAALPEKPSLQSLRNIPHWVLRKPGTCPAAHLRKMAFERLGSLPLLPDSIAPRVPQKTILNHAISDISLANQLFIGPHLRPASIRYPGEPVSNKYGRPFQAIAAAELFA